MHSERVLIAGSTGLVGQVFIRCLSELDQSLLLMPPRSEVDFTQIIEEYFSPTRPTRIILAAPKVGGIRAKS